MGRKSLADRRSAEILDAVQVCLVKYGVAGTTLPRIAAEAGMATSIIRHYLGDKEAVIQAAIERSLENVRNTFAEVMDAAAPEQRLAAGLDALFDPRLAVPEINQIVDELVANSYFDDATRARLRRVYREFQVEIRKAIRFNYPRAENDQVEVVVLGLMAMGHAGATFAWLGIDRANYRKLRAAADALVATLEPPAAKRGKGS